MAQHDLSPGFDALVALESILDRFEAECRSGRRPSLDEYVGLVAESLRLRLFAEMLSLELAYRREAGESPDLQDYLTRFPQFADQVRDGFCKPVAREGPPARCLKIRCPHCHNPIEVVSDDPSDDVSCPSCGSNFNLVNDVETARYLDSGRMLGHFQLLDRLGQGAFGEVWKARDTELDRIIALKIPRREHLTEAETEQFLREARAAAQVRHPNIVSVFEIGREHGVIYIASDFIDGATLADWIDAHPLSVRESAELCAKIAEALHHAHEAGVVHRDLKPQNILVRSGELLVASGEQSQRPSSNSPLPTPHSFLSSPTSAWPSARRAR